MGFNLVRHSEGQPPQESFPRDFDDEAIEILRTVKPYTMTSVERQFALIQAVRYVVRANIPGSIVECGVWRGGSMMAVAHTLKRLTDDGRDLYLFDTYEGMTRPTDLDICCDGKPALIKFERTNKTSDTSDWCYASIEEVQRNLVSTGYNTNRLKFIKGKVEDTLPRSAPNQISLLRLDTDWYESTRHELIHLFPRLSAGGVLIIDDYGHWQGSKKATDEYLAQNNIFILLNRIDSTGTIAVKLPSSGYALPS
jgi:hypothetical protein